ncbi:PD-(D/E)XK nuclease family transposase [Phascolarctobacterium sp.]|uniref:PD-(D/E)XK nuclease family transposase n=1 Tax=Phascolarctobacterium sp. TaxID=2049039 RepID=UPI003F7D9DFE
MSQTRNTEDLLEKLARLKAAIPSMNMFRDLFAQAVLMDNASCEHVLRILTGNNTLKVKKNNIQHLISKLTSHNIIMDVLVEDANHKLYEIEIQKAAGNIAHEKRMLYYASSIINDYFFKGDQTYDSVPELHIFYISETDIWHRGKTYYPVLKHLGDLTTPYDDGLHMYYINAEVNDNSEIANLMQFFKTADANDNSQGSLSQRITTLKTKKEGLTFMDDLIKEFYDAGADKGKAEGKVEATLKNLKSLMATCKCSVDKAMDLLETPAEERQYYKDLLNQH